MSSVHNSVETVNAAATAIVTAESRVQPSAVQVCVYIHSYKFSYIICVLLGFFCTSLNRYQFFSACDSWY